jgi:hypothetical protein
VTTPVIFPFDGKATVYYRGRRFIIASPIALKNSGEITEYLDGKISDSGRRKKRFDLRGITIFNEPISNAISQTIVNFIPSRLKFFFLMFATNFAVLLFILWNGIHSLEPVSSSNFSGIAAVIFAVMLMHELGHAAAARKAGIRVDRIGLGLYLVFPALFTSISMLRLLPPLRQVPIILGGTFAQCAALLGLAAMIAGLGISSLEAPYLILQSMTLFNLAPIFQLDGRRALEAYQAASGDKTSRIALGIGSVAAVVLIGWVLARQVQVILRQLTLWRETGDVFSLGYGLFILAMFVVGMALGARAVLSRFSTRPGTDPS